MSPKRKRASSKDLEKLLRELERQLPECVSSTGKHYKIKTPNGQLVIAPVTGGKGNRSWQNMVAQLRRGGFEL